MHCLVITTCKPEDEEKIVNALLNENLAACINSYSVNSTYIWKGKVEREEEKILFIKTKKEKYKEVEKKIKEVHSYEVPEIICLDIKEGNESYLKWIDEVVK
jgi:periplasmic divalent cation tolerance protein